MAKDVAHRADLRHNGHDLRTPLTVIIGYTELMQGRLEQHGTVTPTDLRLWLAQMHAAAHRLEDAIAQLTEAQAGADGPLNPGQEDHRGDFLDRRPGR
jgi:signal transduction histidine kinase